MITLQLPDEVWLKLEALAASSGLPASVHAERAIADYLGDLEDYAAAVCEVEEVRAGRSATVPLAEMMKRYGVAD